ncbi:MAG: type II toxin-antitoxin system RelE/ParE family toxin [Planctomycetaceae bacterium]|nr:type II toxin-antitoxin system RelE/ParE family toxin [Planctomycetaceae bacterium]
MKIRWLRSGLVSLRSAHAYVQAESPRQARELVVRLERAIQRLEEFPNSGRNGTVPGTTELVIPNLPYLVVYRVMEEEVQILRFFHIRRYK